MKGSCLVAIVLCLSCGQKASPPPPAPNTPTSASTSASTPTTTAAPPGSTPDKVTASQRVEAWKKKLPADWKSVETKAAAFVHLAGWAPGENPESKAILATERGETEDVYTVSLGAGEVDAIDISDVGDLDGDGAKDVLLSYTKDMGDGGLALFLDTPAGPKKAWSMEGSGSGKASSYQGKPALLITIVNTEDASEANAYVFWSGSAFEQKDAPAPASPTVTLVSLESGDRACYVSVKAADGTESSLEGSFDFCDDDTKKLIGHKITYKTRKENVLAASCDGDMDCGKSDEVDLVIEIKPAE